MNKKKFDINAAVKVFYPMFLYMAISSVVQVVVYIILFFLEVDKINKVIPALTASYTFVDELSGDINRYSNLILGISALISIFIFGYIYYKDCRLINGFEVKEQMTFCNGKNILTVAAFGFFGSMGISRFLNMFPLDNIVGNYSEVSERLLDGNLILQICSVGILVPIAEEIIYRGIIYNRSKIYFDKKTAAILTSILFGVAHMNLLQGISSCILSIAMIYCLEYYKSLVPAIIIHAVNNSAVVILSYYKIDEVFGDNIWVNIIIMTLELAVASLIFIIRMIDDEKGKNYE